MFGRLAFGFVTVALVALFGLPSVGRTEPNRHEIIVGLHGQGPFRIEGCADDLTHRQSPLSAALADGSPSLDTINARFRLSPYRALFRRPAVGRGAAMASARRRFSERFLGQRGGSRDRPPDQAALSAAAAPLFDVYAVSIPADADINAAIDALASDPHVAFVQPDAAVHLDSDFDDRYLESSGAWGQTHEDLWGHHSIRALDAWDLSLGDGVVVAVVDSGLDFDHPELEDQVWINPGEDVDGDGRFSEADLNGVDDDGNGFVDDVRGWDFTGYTTAVENGESPPGDSDPSDENGHGTHVAGTIAAAAGNGIGIAGVAPFARVMAIKAFSADGSARSSDAWRGVVYAAENGARVVNASFSCGRPCPENPMARMVMELLAARDVVFVTSAGNAASDVVRSVPENLASAITVGGHGVDDERTSSSNFGWLVDVVAPGGGPDDHAVPLAARNVLSLRASARAGSIRAIVGGIFERRSGTSMAAPHVSGTAALLLAQRPDLTPRQVRRLLRMSARPLGATGHDPDFGAGALDARAALEMEAPRLELELSEPATGAVLSNVDGEPVLVRGIASGDDLESVEVAISAGVRGEDFEPIASGFSREAPSAASSSARGEEVLAQWDASGAPDGPYVVRLRATLASGATVDEYAIFGIERTRPLRLSAADVGSKRPSVSGRSVVWEQSLGSLPPEDGEEPVDTNGIGFARFARPGEAQRSSLLFSQPGGVHQPSLDRGWLAWSASGPTGEDPTIAGCRLVHEKNGERTCRRFAGAPLDSLPLAMRFARRTAFWSASRDGGFALSGCRFGRGDRCEAIEIFAPDDAGESRILADYDGDSLLWKRGGAGARLEICPLRFPGKQRCDPMPVLVGGREIAVEEAAIDGGLAAITIAAGTESLLGACRVDAIEGSCDAQVLGAIVPETRPVVSGNRIAWIEPRADSFGALVYCEFDSTSGRCPIQRVSGAPAPILAPDIDGRFLVWEDGRFDEPAVMGLELPALRLARAHVRARHGRVTVVARTRGFEAAADRVRLERLDADGPVPIPFDGFRRAGRRFSLRFETTSAAPVEFVLVATAASGLETRSTFVVEPPIKRRSIKGDWSLGDRLWGWLLR